MLREIPRQALSWAIDNVVPGSSLGLAEDANKVLDYAQRRAAEVVARAHVEAELLHRQALEAGYAHGYHDAMAALLPAAQAAMSQVELLRDSALEQVRQALRRSLESLDVQAALIERWASALQSVPVGAWVLHLPDTDAPLVERLQQAPALKGVDLRVGGVTVPTLEAGALVYELDAERVLLQQAHPGLTSSAVDAQAQALSVLFARQCLAQIEQRKAQRSWDDLNMVGDEHAS